MIFRWKSHYKAIPLHTIPHNSAQFREDLIAFLVRNYSAKKWRKRKQSLRAIPRIGILIWNPTFSLLYNLKDAGVKKRKQQKSVRSERKSTHIEKHDVAWKLLYGIEIKNKVESYRSNTRTKKLWLEEIIVSCDVICGADGKKGVVCLPSCRAYAFDGKGS